MRIYSSIAANKTKTWLIMVLFVIFITSVAYVFSRALGYGLYLVVFALIFGGLTSIGSYYYSDKLVLATSGAKEIKKTDNPELFRTVENLCIGDGLQMPKIYIINDPSPNAFATGRDPKNSVICFTTGILEKLNKIELEGVIAHELSHVKNYDIRLMGVVAILVGFIALLANLFMQQLWFGGIGGRDRDEGGNNLQVIFLVVGIILAILSPIAATLIQLAVSRKREFLADASGALLTRYPEGLAEALEKISNDPTGLKKANNATAHLFIINPFKGKAAKSMFSSLFDTHPPIEERIKALREM
jgi:heat shock protein HtpX